MDGQPHINTGFYPAQLTAASRRPLTDGSQTLSVSSNAKLTLANARTKVKVWSPPFAVGGTGPASFCLLGDGSVLLETTKDNTLYYMRPGLPGSKNLKGPYTMSISKGNVTVKDDTCTTVLTVNPATRTRMSAAVVRPMQESGTCSTVLAQWGQCGGRSCPSSYGLTADKCTDAQYSGMCCPTGWNCMRQHEWWVKRCVKLGVTCCCARDLLLCSRPAAVLATCLLSSRACIAAAPRAALPAC